MSFYVDSCIYLNLWKKEERGGVKFWQIADNFFKTVEKRQDPIYLSSFVLKELYFKFDAITLRHRLEGMYLSLIFKRAYADSQDYDEARRLESASGFEISFFDCMHIVLSKRMGVILVTRDKKLLDFACTFCSVSRPEDIQ